MRIDLHLHSIESGASTNWWVKGLGLGLETRESYTPPEEAYRKAKAAGMDFANLTDHETINGAVTLTDHPDSLVGEEVGTVFPEDNSHIDVLVYGLDASHQPEIQARRPNVYALVEYLREAGLVHVLAHPLFEVGAPLTRAGVEKRMVLFPLWVPPTISSPRLGQPGFGPMTASSRRRSWTRRWHGHLHCRKAHDRPSMHSTGAGLPPSPARRSRQCARCRRAMPDSLWRPIDLLSRRGRHSGRFRSYF
jgi:hypothetical protein